MENTIENKARFFAQYYGQKITFIDAKQVSKIT